MNDLIVIDHPINYDGNILSWSEFIDKASSDEGIQVSGELYINVKCVDQDMYYVVVDSMPSVKFFSLDGWAPDFIDISKVYDFEEYAVVKEQYGREKQTAVANAQDFDDNESGENDGDVVQSLTGDPTIHHNEGAPNDVNEESYETKQARIILFGSSKGGTGKTFTSLISAYRYAKKHPDQRVAVSDFDIIDGQVGITIHKIAPTMLDYYKKFNFGQDDFETMKQYKVKSENFPDNLDFYLAPRDIYIQNDEFWDSIFVNLIENYDVVFFDSGIDYMNYKPISTLYKIADKIILVSTTSIKSVSSVSKQIGRLKGTIKNPVFSEEDGIGDRLNLVITQAGKHDEMNSKVFATFQSRINIVGVFGMLTPEIQKAEYYGSWDIFDKNAKFNETLDRMVE